MTPRRKKQCTYFCIGIYFLLGGIEYAVVLPTLWLYLENRFQARTYFLGLTLSAFSFAGLFSSPLMGRWSDKTRRTKWILVFCNLWEIVGNLLYMMGVNVWFVLVGRLVAGFGAGVTAAVIADLARSTMESERTAVLSVFITMFSVGQVVGPALNLFLRKSNFHIGPFLIDKYSSPGAFMALIYILYEFLVIFLYYELTVLRDEELREQINYTTTDVSSIPNVSAGLNSPELRYDEPFTDTPESSAAPYMQVHESARTGKVPVKTSKREHDFNPVVSPSINIQASTPNYICDDLGHAEEEHNLIDSIKSEPGEVNPLNDESPLVSRRYRKTGRPLAAASTPSSQLIERAEALIGASSGSFEQLQKSHRESSRKRSKKDKNRAESQGERTQRKVAIVRPQRQSPAEEEVRSVQRPTSYGAVSSTPNSSSIMSEVDLRSEVEPETHRQTNTWEDTGSTCRQKLRFFYNEYIREEIVAIMAACFVGFFNQVAFETMVTPLTERLLGWGELENSLIYCGAGIEVILVFILVRYASRRFSDRIMILVGFFLELAAVIWFLCFLPGAKQKDPGKNVWFMIVGIIIDVAGMPILVVVVTSLYSKITSQKTQGFSQGLRRMVASMAFIMAPLWASALLDRLYIMLGVMLSLMLLALVMLLLSFKYLKHDRGGDVRPVGRRSGLLSADDAAKSLARTIRDSEERPLLA